ncbi:hypothetical protein ES319_A07G163300v1 [Gossypium barbadense]|uniref:Uncharacterized protein n=1 Tax=Gossypium barbadense TaxID=3634 RepID=A0A5J5V408_GOSBA|nr:hypothetical protein ES319_A07G163300v1 [Gossypium barbadense]
MSEDDEWQQSPPSDLEFVSNKARDCNATGSGSGHPEFQSTYPDQLMKVPRVESKLRVFCFKIQFRTQVSKFKRSLNTVNSACNEAKKLASQYQKEADKCNSGMETCEEVREKAEEALSAQMKLTAM